MRRLLLVALLMTLSCVSVEASNVKLFGYYSYAPEQEGHVNMTFLPQGPARPGLRYILQSPFDTAHPAALSVDAIRTWFDDATGGDTSLVLAVWLTDEPELNAPHAQAEFDASVAIFRAALPGIALWVNFSTLLPQVWPGYRPPDALDLLSFDNNGDTPPAAMPALAALAYPHQRFLMLPPGLRGLHYKTETDMVTAANAIYAYAQSDSRVIGLIVYNWHDSVGAVGVEHLPLVRENFERIGREIIAEPELALFDDVPVSHPFAPWIATIVHAGVMPGCWAYPPLFCPDAPVTRAEMAELIVRASRYPDLPPLPAPVGVFADVPPGHPFAAWVEGLYAGGVTTGCDTNPPRYCPEALVTRAEIAVLLLRARHGGSYQPPPATGHFGDVPTHDVFASWIEQLAAEGITSGCGPETFCPDDAVTRGQMAVFLVKALL